MVRQSPTRSPRDEVRPGSIVRLPRRIIDRILPSGSDDRVVVREIYARRVFVQSLANPAAAFYVRRTKVLQTT